MRKLVLVLSVPWLTLAVPASAHFNMTMPPTIAKTDANPGGKGPAPCGPDTATAGTVTPVTGGTVLKLHIDETTPHPGFYRFALSLTSPPQFPADNVVKNQAGMVILPTDKQALSSSADFENPAKFPVLADHMFVHTTGGAQPFPSTAYPGEVKIPNLNCDSCTLQVIEFMAQHGSNGDSAGYFYHHCALLKITVDPNLPIFDPNDPSGGGGGGAGGAGGAAGSAGAATAGAGGTGFAGNTGADIGGAFNLGGAPSVAGAGAGGTLATAGAPGAAGFSPGGLPAVAGAGTNEPASDGGCSYALGSHPKPSKSALALLLGLVGLAGMRRRRARSRRR